MNYLKKCIISALESDIYYRNAYEVGLIIGKVIKRLSYPGNKHDCDEASFLKGVNEAFDKEEDDDTNESH